MCKVHITVLVPHVSLLRDFQTVIPLHISSENSGVVQLIKYVQAQAFFNKGSALFFH